MEAVEKLYLITQTGENYLKRSKRIYNYFILNRVELL